VERRTEIVTLGSGFERRSTPWAQGRRRYLIGANLRSLDDMAVLTSFFEARRGRLYGFRFRDFADFRSCTPGTSPSAMDQMLGHGDGIQTGFALTKRYGGDETAADRRIFKPVDGTVRVAVSGIERPEGTFTVDHVTGMVTLDEAPATGDAVTAGFEFDTPVRFDTDRIEVALESFAAGRMTAAPLIEVRV
jgi:uncharacterized protein (TIGR02217 family)